MDFSQFNQNAILDTDQKWTLNFFFKTLIKDVHIWPNFRKKTWMAKVQTEIHTNLERTLTFVLTSFSVATATSGT